MLLDPKIFAKAFPPHRIAKAFGAFDKSTAIVISACWIAAFVTLFLAAIAVHAAVSARMESSKALAAEPVLPSITSAPIPPREMQGLVEALQRQFPDIKIELKTGQGLTIKSDDGAKFHQWITALSFIDTMAPQYRWTLREFCTGACMGSGQGLMSAVLSGQKIVMAMPRK